MALDVSSDTPESVLAFNFLALAIFRRLYDRFPEPMTIEGLRFVLEHTLDYGPGSKEAAYSRLFSYTMEWLEREGFLRWDNVSLSDNYEDVVLTLKGLTVLGFVPSSILPGRQKEPLIARVRRVVGGGVEGAGTEAVSNLVSQLMTVAVKLANS